MVSVVGLAGALRRVTYYGYPIRPGTIRTGANNHARKDCRRSGPLLDL